MPPQQTTHLIAPLNWQLYLELEKRQKTEIKGYADDSLMRARARIGKKIAQEQRTAATRLPRRPSERRPSARGPRSALKKRAKDGKEGKAPPSEASPSPRLKFSDEVEEVSAEQSGSRARARKKMLTLATFHENSNPAATPSAHGDASPQKSAGKRPPETARASELGRMSFASPRLPDGGLVSPRLARGLPTSRARNRMLGQFARQSVVAPPLSAERAEDEENLSGTTVSDSESGSSDGLFDSEDRAMQRKTIGADPRAVARAQFEAEMDPLGLASLRRRSVLRVSSKMPGGSASAQSDSPDKSPSAMLRAGGASTLTASVALHALRLNRAEDAAGVERNVFSGRAYLQDKLNPMRKATFRGETLARMRDTQRRAARARRRREQGGGDAREMGYDDGSGDRAAFGRASSVGRTSRVGRASRRGPSLARPRLPSSPPVATRTSAHEATLAQKKLFAAIEKYSVDELVDGARNYPDPLRPVLRELTPPASPRSPRSPQSPRSIGSPPASPRALHAPSAWSPAQRSPLGALTIAVEGAQRAASPPASPRARTRRRGFKLRGAPIEFIVAAAEHVTEARLWRQYLARRIPPDLSGLAVGFDIEVEKIETGANGEILLDAPPVPRWSINLADRNGLGMLLGARAFKK